MALVKGLSGIDVVFANLHKAAEQIEKQAVNDLIEIGRRIRLDGMKLTPVAAGNLINSWYGPTPFKVGMNQTIVEIGLTAYYAVYVHENLEAHFQKPGASAKFLEKPLIAHAKDLATNISTTKDFTK